MDKQVPSNWKFMKAKKIELTKKRVLASNSIPCQDTLLTVIKGNKEVNNLK